MLKLNRRSVVGTNLPGSGRVRTGWMATGRLVAWPVLMCLGLSLLWWAQNALCREEHGPDPAAVKVVRMPENSLVPDAVVDDAGTWHVVYGLDHNAYYLRSTNDGASFSRPVKVNSSGTVETEMGERGPKLAVGSDGVVHVVWADDWAPGVKTFVRYGRSVDHGKTFSPLSTVSSMSGVDGVTVAADGLGNVLAFWHVMAEPKPEVPQATWLYLARSTNNGVSFGTSEKVRINNHPGLACSMCMTRARIGLDRAVYLVFRSAAGNVRDFYVLQGNPAANDFKAVRVNQDNWTIDYCPMVGPELTFDASGRAWAAYMSSNRVYWSVSDYPVKAFRQHVATPANQDKEIYPTVVANRRGEALFLWQVGPMSTTGTAVVKWATYNVDGSPTGRQGTVGTSSSGTKATAVAGRDGCFYILTTAK